VDIISRYKEIGYIKNLKSIFEQSNTYYFRLIATIFSFILPENPVIGLYLIFYPLYLICFINILIILKEILKNKLKVILIIYIFLSSNFFSWVWGGIIDQRLDFLSATLFSCYFLNLYFLFDKSNKKNFFSYILLTILLILHRPLFFLYIPILFFYFFVIKRNNFFKLITNKFFLIINLFTYFILFLFLNKNTIFIFNYYLHDYDIGRNSYLESVYFVFNNLINQLGVLNLIILLLLFLLIKTNKFNILLKFLFLILILISPFLISKSATNHLPFLSISFILLFSFLIELFKNIYIKKTLFLVLLTSSLILILRNNFILLKEVITYPKFSRNRLEYVLQKLYSDNPFNFNRRIYISGIGISADYLYGLDKLYYKKKYFQGKFYHHITDFNVNKKYQKNALSNSLYNRALIYTCKYPGFFIVLNNKNKNNPNAYLYVERFVEQIYKEVEKLPCLEKKLFDFEYDNKYYSVFLIK
jgi:hypothetical protein